jgi:putative transposase
LSEVASVALVQSVRGVRRAYIWFDNNWFDSIGKRGKGRKVGRPRFKARTTGDPAGSPATD